MYEMCVFLLCIDAQFRSLDIQLFPTVVLKHNDQKYSNSTKVPSHKS